MELPDTRPATYQVILDLPENLVGEIIDGRLVTHPRLTSKAFYAKNQLGGVLALHFGHLPSARPLADSEQQD